MIWLRKSYSPLGVGVGVGGLELGLGFSVSLRIGLGRSKEILSDIHTNQVTSNWWRDFSTWEDFHSLLRSGAKLSMHDVVSKLNENLKLIQNSLSYIEWIDENGNMDIILDEMSATLLQGFTITARRRKLRRLKDISAYKVAGLISGKSEINKLQLPISLRGLVASFLDTYSRDL